MARFEASYYPGEDGERLPEWRVVEWTYVNPENGSKMGNTVWKSYDMMNGEREANEMAAILQHEYNLRFAEEFA